MIDIPEKNRLHNQYRKEADLLKIGSPYRIDEYIRYRMRGLSIKKSLEKTKAKRTK